MHQEAEQHSDDASNGNGPALGDELPAKRPPASPQSSDTLKKTKTFKLIPPAKPPTIKKITLSLQKAKSLSAVQGIYLLY
jgi:hypothetical protein